MISLFGNPIPRVRHKHFIQFVPITWVAHTEKNPQQHSFAITLFHDADIWAFIEFSTECHTIITTRSSKLNVMETTQFTTTAFHMAWSWSFFVFSLDFLISLHQVCIFRKWRQNCATTAFRVTDDFTQCVTWTMHFGVEVLEAIFTPPESDIVQQWIVPFCKLYWKLLFHKRYTFYLCYFVLHWHASNQNKVLHSRIVEY